MASLIESLTQTLTPDLVGQIGKATGLDNSLASKGLEIVGPLVTGALANTASTPQGLSGLMSSLSQSGGSGLGNVASMIAGGGASPSMMSGLFGAGLGAIGGTLDKALGFRASPLIAMAAPVVMSLMSQRMASEKLDGSGVAKLLQDEQAAVLNKGDATSRLVRQALDAGQQAVTTKSKYSKDQWADVRLGAAAAAARVMSASPSGVLGTSKEALALGEAVAASKKDAAPTAMLSLAFETKLSEEEIKSLPDDGPALVNVVRRAAQAVAANSPADAIAYGRLLVDVATRVAEASKEGGFLGFGGTRVSEQEHAAIVEIGAAVGQTAQAAG
jgi:hypothetical protein